MVRGRRVCSLKLRRLINKIILSLFIKEMKAGRTNNKEERSVGLLDLIQKEKKSTIQEERLKNMVWGMGLEHEAQYFYIPLSDKPVYSVDEIVVVATQLPAIELIKYYNIPPKDQELLKKINWEMTGRKCGGKVILPRLNFFYNDKKQPLRMPEFITSEPFSTLKDKKTIEYYIHSLIEKENRYVQLIEENPAVAKFIEKYHFKIRQYPFGMSSNIRVREDYSYIDPKLFDKHYQDYTGSFHFTITLPHERKDIYTDADQKKFTERHYNFGAMFQWIEPLLLSAYFSCDQKAVGTKEKRIRGSFRVARVGWGNFAGSDMSKINKEVGIGRYANVEPYWRNGFEYHESKLTESCRVPHWEEDQAISSFSSNIRTFAPDPNPAKSGERISGAKMTIPNGFEIRIFDHFPTICLVSLLQIIILIAANSETTKVTDFVYDDEDWKRTLRKIMLEGWKAEIDILFLKKLEKVFNVTLNPSDNKAFSVLENLVKELYDKNKNSDIVFMMYGRNYEPEIPMINKYSWDFSFMLKLYSDEKTFQSYEKFIENILKKNLLSEFKDEVIKNFGQEWESNWLDILYFMEGKELLSVSSDDRFKLNLLFLKEFVTKYQIMNEIIIQLNLNHFCQFHEDHMQPIKDSIFFNFENIRNRYKKFIDYSKKFKNVPIYC